MLAEKFFLLLETLKSHTHPCGSPPRGEHLTARPGQTAQRQVVSKPPAEASFSGNAPV
jgi:hypothetical protein